MKKSLIILAALSLGLVACNKETESPLSEGSRLVKITASREAPATGVQTKTTVSDEGAFAWSEGDKIKVYITNTNFGEMTLESGANTENGTFTGALSGTVSTVAVFPANIFTSFSGNTLTLSLPSEIAWVAGQADNLMIAKGFGEGATNLAFKNIGGLIKVTLKNVPANANKVTFTTGKKISGEFTCDISAETPVITAGTDSDDDVNGVTFTFETATDARDMVFYVPVPTGTYSKIGFKVKNGGTVLMSFQSSSSNEIVRGRLLTMPELTITTISGGGESSILSVEVPANQNGSFTLPKTSSSIAVKLNQTSGTVSLDYATGASDSEKPANVYITVADGATVSGLTINLPASHVELNGNGTTETAITNVTSSTNTSTLVLKKVKVDKLTISKGSLKVQEESQIATSLTVAEDAAASDDETNKISIELASGTSVAAITVSETNCDFSIAGSVTGTVTTVASNATVESSATVNSFTVNGGSAIIQGSVNTVSAGNSGTTVEIVSGAKVDSITASDSANVEVAADVTNTEGTAAPTTSGTITTNCVKMVIGDETTYHATVNEAITSAEGQTATIDLLADVEETANIASFTGGDNITINLNGHKLKADGNSEWSDARGFKFSNFSSDINLTINGTTANSEVAFGAVRTGFFIGEGSNDAKVNLTLNGGTYNLGDKPWYGIIQKTAGTVTIDGVTFNSSFNGSIEGFSGTYSGSVIMMERGTLTMSNSTISSNVCGGVYIAGKGEEYSGPADKCADSFTWTATGTLTNCTISNTVTPENYPWQSSSLAVAYGNTLTVSGGTYTSPKAAAYVFSSGGTITLNDGTYKGKLKADYDTGYNVSGNGSVKHSYINYSSSCDISDATTTIEAQNKDCSIQCVVKNASALASAIANTKVDKITLANDITTEYIYLTSKGAHIDLNGHTLKLDGGSYNWGIYINPTAATGINFKIDGTVEGSKVVFGNKVYGIYVTAGSDDQQSANVTLEGGCYEFGNNVQLGVDCFPRAGKLVIKNVTMTSSYPYSGSPLVYYWGGKPENENYGCELENVNITTEGSGCLQIGDAKGFWTSASDHTGIYIASKALVKNCSFENKKYSRENSDGKYSWMASALMAAVNSTIDVESGSFKGSTASAYVFSSGGTINLKEGTYTGDFKADADRSTYNTAESNIYYSSSCDITGVTNKTEQNEHCKIGQKSF